MAKFEDIKVTVKVSIEELKKESLTTVASVVAVPSVYFCLPLTPMSIEAARYNFEIESFKTKLRSLMVCDSQEIVDQIADRVGRQTDIIAKSIPLTYFQVFDIFSFEVYRRFSIYPTVDIKHALDWIDRVDNNVTLRRVTRIRFPPIEELWSVPEEDIT